MLPSEHPPGYRPPHGIQVLVVGCHAALPWLSGVRILLLFGAGLRRYTAVETLAGDNAYSCERCGQKVRAQRRLAFEVAPNALQLCLKRFLSVRAPAPQGGSSRWCLQGREEQPCCCAAGY